MGHDPPYFLPLGGGERPAIGFYTTRVVAASNIREAEQLAIAAVRREWHRKGFEDAAGSAPTLAVEEIRLLAERFRLRSGAGFTFYDVSEDDEPGTV